MFFSEQLDRLVGKILFFAFSGPSTGASLDLHFSPLVPRVRPLKSPLLSEMEKNSRGEYGLFIHCGWRFSRESLGRIRVTLGSSDLCETSDHAKVTELLGSMLDDKVVDLSFCSKTHDLRITFSSNSTLELFCDRGITVTGDYWFFVPGGVYTVGSSGVEYELDVS